MPAVASPPSSPRRLRGGVSRSPTAAHRHRNIGEGNDNDNDNGSAASDEDVKHVDNDDDDDDERPKHRLSSSFSSYWTSAIDAIGGRARALAFALARRGPDDGGVVSRRGDDHDDYGVEWGDDPRAFRIASQLAPHLGASSAEHVRDLLTAMVLCECVYKSSDAEVRSKVAEFQAEFPPG